MNDHARDAQDARDPVAADIDERNPESGDIVAGEQVLDDGKVSPSQDEVGDHDDGSTAHEREHAADERTDPGAAPIQPEAS